MKEDCKMCNLVSKLTPDSPGVIDNGKYFSVVLNPKFSPHLGRAAIVSKAHKEYSSEFSKKVDQELSNMKRALRNAQHEAFGPSSIPHVFLDKYIGHFNLDFYPCYYDGVGLDVRGIALKDLGDYVLINPNKQPLDNMAVIIGEDKIFYTPSNEFLRSYRHAPEMPEPLIKKIAGEIAVNYHY